MYSRTVLGQWIAPKAAARICKARHRRKAVAQQATSCVSWAQSGVLPLCRLYLPVPRQQKRQQLLTVQSLSQSYTRVHILTLYPWSIINISNGENFMILVKSICPSHMLCRYTLYGAAARICKARHRCKAVAATRPSGSRVLLKLTSCQFTGKNTCFSPTNFSKHFYRASHCLKLYSRTGKIGIPI